MKMQNNNFWLYISFGIAFIIYCIGLFALKDDLYKFSMLFLLYLCVVELISINYKKKGKRSR